MIPQTVVMGMGATPRAIEAFDADDRVLAQPEVEIFPDGERGYRLPVQKVKGRPVLLVGESVSEQSILATYDVACALQQYEATTLGIVFPDEAHWRGSSALSSGDVALDRLIGHIFSSVPRAPYGNTFYTFDRQKRELYHQSLRPSADFNSARSERARLHNVVKDALNPRRQLRGTDQSSDPWLITPATGAGLAATMLEDAQIKGLKTMLLSIPSYQYLRDEVAKLGDYEVSAVTRMNSSNGIRLCQAPEDVIGRDVLIVAGTPVDMDFMDLASLICSCVERGAAKLTIAMPYLGCARMDRAVHEGDIVTAKTRARMLSFLPQAPLLNTFIFFDLHTFGVQHYFEGPARRSHWYLEAVMNESIQSATKGRLKFVCSPDIGHAKWTRAFARANGLEECVIDKVRVSGSKTQGFRLLVGEEHIRGNAGLVHDDMTCTCGTLIGAGKQCQSQGPEDMFVAFSHGVFCGDGIQKLRESGHYRRCFVSNSHPRAYEAAKAHPDFIELISVAPAIHEAFTKGTIRA